MSDLVARVRDGNIRAAGRLISMIEAGDPSIEALLSLIYPHTGKSFRIGVTGPPGAGKSTLICELAGAYLASGRSVGIIAVDITSPFTGGALLGDRIRMQELTRDDRVFIRSIGNDGRPGGLSRSAQDAMRVLEAMGKGVVIVETAGVGQTDVDVVDSVDAVVLVTVPEAGDEVQALKAGILEAADVIVLNKADRPEADGLGTELQELATGDDVGAGWQVPVIRTAASTGYGVDKLCEAINAYETYAKEEDRLGERRKLQLEKEMRTRLREKMIATVDHSLDRIDLSEVVNLVNKGEKDLYEVVKDLVNIQKS